MLTYEAIAVRLLAKIPGLVDVEQLVAGPAADMPDIETGFYNIIEYGGGPGMSTHNDGFGALTAPSVQIVAHALDLNVAYEWAERAWGAFVKDNSVVNEVVGDVFFLFIRPLHRPFPLTLDPKDRNRVAFSMETLRRG